MKTVLLGQSRAPSSHHHTTNTRKQVPEIEVAKVRFTGPGLAVTDRPRLALARQGVPRCSPRQRHPLNILTPGKGGGGGAQACVPGDLTYIPQNDPLVALIILNTHMWGF